MPTLDVDGTTVHYGDVGKGDPIVCLHSGGSTGAQWRRMAGYLDQQWRVLTIDFYGMGKTDPWPGPADLTHDDECDLVAALIAAAGEPAHLVGHSYGGAVALRMAVTKRAALASLTLIEPMAMPLLDQAGESEAASEYEALRVRFLDGAENGREAEALEPYVDYWNGAGTWANLADDARAKLAGRADLLCAAFRANASDPTTLDECRGLTCPVLIVCGERTRPPAKRVTEVLAGIIPSARRVVIPGAGHMSPVSHAADVAAAVAGHLGGAKAA